MSNSNIILIKFKSAYKRILFLISNFQLKRINKNQNGFSLVEILLATGIMSIVLFFLSQTILNQLQTTKSIEQKLDTLDIKSALIQIFANNDICLCHVNKNSQVFNATSTVGAESINVDKITLGCDANSPIYLRSGDNLPSGLTVSSIKLNNLKPSAPNSTVWSGQWQINFSDLKFSKPIKPIKLLQIFSIDDATSTSAKIVSCSNSSPPAKPTSTWCDQAGVIDKLKTTSLTSASGFNAFKHDPSSDAIGTSTVICTGSVGQFSCSSKYREYYGSVYNDLIGNFTATSSKTFVGGWRNLYTVDLNISGGYISIQHQSSYSYIKEYFWFSDIKNGATNAKPNPPGAYNCSAL